MLRMRGSLARAAALLRKRNAIDAALVAGPRELIQLG
jgi:hypothetical protein